MAIETTSIEGLLVVRWPLHDDERGFFRQTVQTAELAAALGRPVRWAQGNHARSRPGVIRGFHAEPWDKCVYVTHGTAMSAVADIRPDSPSFGEVAVFRLGDPPGERVRLFIGRGLANAYGAIGDVEVDYVYDVSEEWRPMHGHAIAFDDPDLAVPWPIADPIVSANDRAAPRLRERFPDHPRFAGASAGGP
jgi:dTDP-4-dehydrorhamnose 3,5-epimerase